MGQSGFLRRRWKRHKAICLIRLCQTFGFVSSNYIISPSPRTRPVGFPGPGGTSRPGRPIALAVARSPAFPNPNCQRIAVPLRRAASRTHHARGQAELIVSAVVLVAMTSPSSTGTRARKRVSPAPRAANLRSASNDAVVAMGSISGRTSYVSQEGLSLYDPALARKNFTIPCEMEKKAANHGVPRTTERGQRPPSGPMFSRLAGRPHTPATIGEVTPAYLVLDSGFILETGRPRPRGILIQIESGQRCSRVGRRRVASGWTGAASSMTEVTRILSAIEQGDPQAAEQLLPLVYDELRKLAAQKLAQEKPGQTLQATALVHEAYLRLVDADEARTGTAAGISSPPPPRPCGGSWSTTPAASGDPSTAAIGSGSARRHRPPPSTTDSDDLLALDEALTELARQEPLKAELVKLRYFAGLVGRGGRRVPGHLPGHRQATLGRTPGPGSMHALADGEATGPGKKIPAGVIPLRPETRTVL